MTWNIWWRFGPEWRERQPRLLETLRRLDPDVLALQEVWGTADTTQAHDFAEQLEMHAAFTRPALPPPPVPPETADQEGVEMGVGLISRWPVPQARAVDLPARHNTSPAAMVVTLEHPAGSLHVIVACLEWEPAYNDDRVAQAHKGSR